MQYRETGKAKRGPLEPFLPSRPPVRAFCVEAIQEDTMSHSISQAVATAINNTPITMTSLEMVEFINSQRKEGEAELRHDHFMAKVPKVLGESLVPKFLGTSFYVNGAGNKVPRDIYTFPKREACLMAMSYSYDLQAKVFDRMTVLEAEKAAQYQHAINPANWSRMQLIELAMQAEQERMVLEAKVRASKTPLCRYPVFSPNIS